MAANALMAAAYVHSADIAGWCETGFEPLAGVLATNIAIDEDLGAALAIYQHGRLVADLAAGTEPGGKPVNTKTGFVLFSVTKAVATICLMDLHACGKIALDHKVSAYWPEFSANGKQDITVRALMSHQAGLSGFDGPADFDDFHDPSRLAAQLTAQAPAWVLGTAHGYHGLTFGPLVSELVKRVTGITIGHYLSERLAGPLDADVFIGLPTGAPLQVTKLAEPLSSSFPKQMKPEQGSIAWAANENPKITSAAFNDPRLWQAEIASAGGIGTANGVAKLLSTLVKGDLRGYPRDLVADYTEECVYGPDLVLGPQPTRFGAGFMLSCPREPFLSPQSFGHNAWSGAVAFVDPPSGISCAYLVNRPLEMPTPHSRVTRVLAALRAVIEN